MQINQHHVKKFISRFLGILFFAAIFCVTSDCQAQRPRGLFARGARVHHHARHHDTRVEQGAVENNRFPRRHRTPATPRLQNAQNSRNDGTFEVFPKFIGGFHSSHYTNLGLPTGDLGFRGNGLYWAPW